MKLNKALEFAAKNDIKDLIVEDILASSKLITIENGEHESTEISNDSAFVARGSYQGHLVSFESDILDSSALKEMVRSMKSQAIYSKEFDTDTIIERPSVPYQKNRTYSANLLKIDMPTLIDLGKKISLAVSNYDSRIVNNSIQVFIESGKSNFMNTKGLSLSSRASSFGIAIEGVAKEKDKLESDFFIKRFTSLSQVKVDKIVNIFCKRILAKLKSKPGTSGKFTCLFSNYVISSLISPVLEHLSMFKIDQNLSLLANKLDQQVFSEKLTIEEIPNTNYPSSSSYDSEGYPTSNKLLIEAGKICTYLYDQAMAKKYKHAPTGNGFSGGGNIYPGVNKYKIYPGNRSEKELIKTIEEGYIITSIEGMHSGLDTQSGNFTLSASGFYVEKGLKKHMVSQFTISGNLFELLKNIAEVGKETETSYSGLITSSLLIKDILVTC